VSVETSTISLVCAMTPRLTDKSRRRLVTLSNSMNCFSMGPALTVQ